jgi:hypothetical protein
MLNNLLILYSLRDKGDKTFVILGSNHVFIINRFSKKFIYFYKPARTGSNTMTEQGMFSFPEEINTNRTIVPKNLIDGPTASSPAGIVWKRNKN